MSNKLATFAESLGLKQDGKMHFYGILHGYETNFACNSLSDSYPYGFQMHISCYLNDAVKQELALFESSRPMKIFKINFTPYGLWIGFNGMTAKSALEGFSKALEQVLAILEKNNVPGNGTCPHCGEPMEQSNNKVSFMNMHTITVDQKCGEEAEAELAEKKANYIATPNNIKKGIWGALIGAIVSVFLTVVLFFLDIVSAWCPFVGILLGAYLYKRFGGKSNGVMIAICFVLTCTFELLAVFLLHVAAANGLAITNDLSYRGLEAFNYYMNNNIKLNVDSNQTFAGVFTYNMVLSAVFSILGCAAASFDLFRKAKAERGF